MESPDREHSLPLMNKSQKTRSLGLIFCIMLMDIMGITLLYPVAPYLVERYSSQALMVTLLTTIYAAAQFFAAPLLGRFSDRYGRRPVLLVSVLGSAAGYLIFGLGGALWVLFLGRLIDGITGGNLSTASAYIADVSTPEERAKNFTLIGIAWSLGLILGPALGGLCAQISIEAPAFAAAALSMLNVLLGYFMLPESLPQERRETTPLRASDLNPFVSILHMMRKPGLGRLLLALCLYNFAFNGINSTEPLFLIHKFAAQSSQIALQLVLLGVTLTAAQAVAVPRLMPRCGERRTAILCLVQQAFGGLIVYFAPVFWMIYPVTMFNRAISGFVFPAMTALYVNRVPEREQGLLMGVTAALGSLMNIGGPVVAGQVYDLAMPGAPYWEGFAVFLLAALILIRAKEDTARSV